MTNRIPANCKKLVKRGKFTRLDKKARKFGFKLPIPHPETHTNRLYFVIPRTHAMRLLCRNRFV